MKQLSVWLKWVLEFTYQTKCASTLHEIDVRLWPSVITKLQNVMHVQGYESRALSYHTKLIDEFAEIRQVKLKP